MANIYCRFIQSNDSNGSLLVVNDVIITSDAHTITTTIDYSHSQTPSSSHE